MDIQARTAMYRDFLSKEGFNPIVDEGGAIMFRFEGKGYIILVDDDDEFFRLIFPNFWSIDSEDERIKVQDAALHASSRTKVTKIFPAQDDTWAVIEMFCNPPENFKSVFSRSMSALQAGVRTFTEKMNEE